MNEKDNVTQWESRFEEAEHEIANMDEFDYYTLLLQDTGTVQND